MALKAEALGSSGHPEVRAWRGLWLCRSALKARSGCRAVC